MLRLLCVLVLATTAVHSHDDVVLPELPIPVVNRIYPVDDMAAAFQWADRSPWEGQPRWWGADRRPYPPNRWHVVELSESHFEQVSALLAGIQRPQDNRESEFYNPPICDQDQRFGVYLLGRSRGGIQDFSSGNAAKNSGEGDAILWTVGYGLLHDDVEIFANHHLKNRFSVVGGLWDSDTELRDSGFSMQFRLVIADYASCSYWHDHSNDPGNSRHGYWGHGYPIHYGPWTDWIPITSLLDGNVAATPPAAPEQPADNGDDTGNDDTIEEGDTGNDDALEGDTGNGDALARLRAELDALRGDNDALRGNLSTVRDSVAALLDAPTGGTTTTLVDTVEIVRHDTLLFCPPSDEDRQDLFDAFIGINSDSTTNGAPKAQAVKASSWGAIKALHTEDDE